MKLQAMSLLAGLFFGAWPLFMQRSGLSGYVSAVIFSAIVLVAVLPFAWFGGFESLYQANWIMAVAACLTGAAGLLFFNGMLAKATEKTVGSLFLVMIMVQIAVPAFYQMAMTRQYPAGKIIGLVAAVVAAALLA